MWNAIFFDYNSGNIIGCRPLILNLVFENILDSVKKLRVLEVPISILLKFSNNIFAILFGS